jgi:phage terminase large subunit-like protein
VLVESEIEVEPEVSAVIPPYDELPWHLLGDHPAEQYMRDVMSGAVLACRYVKLAVLRHLRDLVTGHARGLWFDRAAAIRRIEFFQFCRHFEGEWAGQVIEPAPHQQIIRWCVNGWKKKDGTRRFHTVYEEVGRKAGKSTCLGSEGLYLAFFDNEAGSQVYTAATKFKQARIVHQSSVQMVKASPALRRKINTCRDNLNVEATASRYEPLGQDSNTEDGLNVHGALIDEYHAHPDAFMYNVLKNGTGSRRNWVLWVITTAGFDKSSACYQEREYAVGILEGIFENDAYFAIIFTLDKEDMENWQDTKNWIKANPLIGITPKWENMLELAQEAAEKPSMRNDFLTKRLNIWTDSLMSWITPEQWDKCNAAVDTEGLRGRRCIGAFDLSSTIDMTAWVLCFLPEVDGDPYQFLFRFFVPQQDIDSRFPNKQIALQIKNWIRLGYITATPGNSIDYDFVESQIKEDAEKYEIIEIAYDKYNATQMVMNLQKYDFEMVEFPQTPISMSPGIKDFEIKVLRGLIAHGGNPVMKWMISCVELWSDSNGNVKIVKPDRGKSVKRVDGPVAASMALDRAVKHTEVKEITQGFIEL